MKIQAKDFQNMKSKQKIAMLTAYTTPVARCLERADISVILVGDTVGMVEMGFESTRNVTLEHMKYHIGAVRRGAPHTHIVGDLPYLSDRDELTALDSAKQLLDAGADSVKLEGPKYDVIRYLVSNGIDVVGHTGLTPQTSGTFKQVGKSRIEADRILKEALEIEKAGAFMVVLEHIPGDLGHTITMALTIPTIGIGAGKRCDGQVLVVNDAVGLGESWPPFSRQYAHVSQSIYEVACQYKDQVESGAY